MAKDNPDESRMGRAYGVAGQVVRESLRSRRPDDARELDAIRGAEVVSVAGQYDQIGRVLEATRIPFVTVEPGRLGSLDWGRLQVLLVNCPGQVPEGEHGRIGEWVRSGGYLLTTDWALKHLLEPLFPGTVRHNGQQTADCVVRVHLDHGDDPLLAGFLEPGRDPLWWLESASYPIEVVDRRRVRVLISSGEVGRQWGADAVAVTFEEGRGCVVHMLSHLYLQRSDVRDARDAQPAATYLQENVAYAAALPLDAAVGLRASDVQSAVSTSAMMANFVLSARRSASRR